MNKEREEQIKRLEKRIKWYINYADSGIIYEEDFNLRWLAMKIIDEEFGDKDRFEIEYPTITFKNQKHTIASLDAPIKPKEYKW